MKEGIGKRPYRMTVRAESARANGSRILDAAAELFHERPFEDVSLEEIADRAGVTLRTVFRRFGSKEELFVTAMDRVGGEMMDGIDRIPVGDVASAVAGYIEHYERYGFNRLRMLAQEDRIPVVARDVEAGRAFHRAWVERAFAAQLAALRGAARTRRVAGLVALTDVYTWKKLRHDLGMSRVEVERTLVELISELGGEQ